MLLAQVINLYRWFAMLYIISYLLHLYNICRASHFTVDLYSNKPILSWKYHKSNCISYPSLTYLTCTQDTYVRLPLGRIIQHKAYFKIKCWLSDVMYWPLSWKCKREFLHEYRMVAGVEDLYPCDRLADWELQCCPYPASRESIRPHSVSPGNDRNLKFKGQFLPYEYHFPTIINYKTNLLSWRLSVYITEIYTCILYTCLYPYLYAIYLFWSKFPNRFISNSVFLKIF